MLDATSTAAVDLKAAALDLAARGFSVVPLAPTGKPKPICKHGFKDATTEPKKIERWWRRWPNARIGMATGPASGISVVDLDAKDGKNGFAHVPDWETRSQVIARTPHGGAHLYFQHVPGLKSSVERLAPGVDIRAEGGLVAVPPSPGYTWKNGSDLSDLPPWPDDLRPDDFRRDTVNLADAFKEVGRRARTSARADHERAILIAALADLPSDNYEDWYQVLAALYNELGEEEGRPIAEQWSAKSPKHDPREFAAKWEECKKLSDVTLGKIFYLADQKCPEWRQALSGREDFEVDRKGTRKARSQKNILHALQVLGVTLSYDSFQDRMLINGLDGYDLLDDAAMSRLWLLIDEKFGFLPPKDFAFTVFMDAARCNAFHPVKDYLALQQRLWDGKRRIRRWLTTYGGAEFNPYTRAVGQLLLVAAARRVRQPGVKFDEMVVLESEQGKNKSTALAALAVHPDWFSDDLPLNADSKRIIEALNGRWFVEAAELNGMRKADVEHLKSFLSRQVDRARMSYGRVVTERPRQCVVVGTTNESQYLQDLSGNRRFWPVKVKNFDLDALRRDRDQIWAEAAVLEAEGAAIRLDPELWPDARQEQMARTVQDPYVDILERELGDKTGKLLVADAWKILNFYSSQPRVSQLENQRLGRAMRDLGWVRKKMRIGGAITWCYTRGSPREQMRRIIVDRRGDDLVVDLEGSGNGGLTVIAGTGRAG